MFSSFVHFEYRFNIQNVLKLLFKKDNFIMINRSETNTMSEFISSCGGLLGLFMGVSVLSIVELIYFLTLRLCCKLRKRETVGNATNVWAWHNNISVLSNQRIAKKSFRFWNWNLANWNIFWCDLSRLAVLMRYSMDGSIIFQCKAIISQSLQCVAMRYVKCGIYHLNQVFGHI